MVSRRYMLRASLLMGTLPLGFGSVGPSHAAAKNRLVVVTQKNSALSELALRELRRLYLAEQVNGPDGRALIPLNHPSGSPTRVMFDKLVLKMSPDDIGRFWIDRKIRGQTGAPRSVPSLDVLRRAVATLPGTLTFLQVRDVTPDLKVLSIDGKGPDAPDYPLSFE